MNSFQAVTNHLQLQIKEIATTIKNITGDSVWLNTGITDELEEYGSEIKGITGAVEVANPELHQKVCPSKSLDKISNMLDVAGDLGFQKSYYGDFRPWRNIR